MGFAGECLYPRPAAAAAAIAVHAATRAPVILAVDKLGGGCLGFSRNMALVPRPTYANIVTCKLVFILKYHFDGTIARHKAHPVVHDSTPFACSSLALLIKFSLSISYRRQQLILDSFKFNPYLLGCIKFS